MSDTEFNKLMTHTVDLRKLERNSGGDFSTIETTSDLSGFVEFKNNLKIVKDGEEINAKAIVYLKSDCGVDIDYKYWMIDQTAPYTRSDLQVLDIEPVDDPRNGLTHHFELIVK